MLGFFSCAAGVILLFSGLLYLGHWYERRYHGATHGFLEKPADRPIAPASSSPEAQESPQQDAPPKE